jgi:hypothetical protein
LEGDQEVPPQDTAASGTASVSNYDPLNKTFDINIAVSNLSPAQVTGFHIHRASVGANGPIIIDFAPGGVPIAPLVPDGVGGFSFTATGLDLDNSLLGGRVNEAPFLGGITYVNIHTAAAPSGLIRGQLFTGGNVNLNATGGPGGTATGTGGVRNIQNVIGGQTADGLVGSFVANTLSGGSGNDVIVGGPNPAPTLDVVTGGSGDDTFVWSNGDGTDVMDGNADVDTVQVNGSVAANDSFTVGANGARVDFDRLSPGPFSLDIGTVETLTVNGIGGNDLFDVGNLAGVADLTAINLHGFTGDDTFNVTPPATGGTSISVFGGNPTVPPGDVLNYDAQGQTVTQTSSPIMATGLQPVAYSNIETVNISNTNGPSVSIVANDGSASEHVAPAAANSGQFTVTRTGDTTSALTVFYTVGGTAGNGADYTTLSGSVVIGMGLSSAVIDVNVINDANTELPESVVLTLSADAAYTLANPTSAFVVIADNEPEVSIVANDGSASEHVSPAAANPGQFTVTRTGDTTSALTVNYTVGGTAGNGVDYTTLSGSVVIGAGQSSAVIDVNVINDANTELPESVVVTLSADAAYTQANPTSAFVVIADNEPEVSITANDAMASEQVAPAPADPGQFTVTRTGDTSSPLTVNYTIGGTAGNGVDYATLSGSVVFGAGQSSAVIDVNVINDGLTEGSETVIVTLAAGAYILADPISATVTISENVVDLTITKTDGSSTETAGTSVTYTIVVSNNGPVGVSGATVTDIFPATLSGVTFTSVASGGATGNTSAGTGNISDTVSLPIGSSITYSATGTIDSSATGTLSNTATVNPPAGATDSNPADNSATDTDTLAGITVTVDGNGRLIIEGTSEDDIVTITGIPPGVAGSGMYLVTTKQGSQPPQTQTLSGVIGDILVNLHAGNDQLTMNNAYVNGSIVIDMESGNDTVTLGNADVVSTRGNLDVDLGTENDTLTGRRIFIAGDQIVVGGDGNDTMTFNGFASPFTLGTSAAGNATWSTGNGNDTVQVIYAFIVGAFTVDLGIGTDSLNIFGSAVSGDVTFVGGAGNDSLTVDTNFFDALLLLDGGADNDTVFLANGLGTDVGTINTGAGDDTVTVRNETQVRANIDTGSGGDTVDVRSSAVDQFFAVLGDDDDELTLFGNLLRLEADLDGGAGGADRLIDLGNDVRGTLRTRSFELFG